MPGSGHPAATNGPGGTGGPPAVAEPGDPDDGLGGLSLVPAAATLLAGLIGIRGPSFTQDEAATLAAVHRGFPQLIHMLGNVDVVHGAYYVLSWAVVRVAGSGELALRLPSAVAMAVAAGFITALGRRLVSTWAGLAAGLTFAALPSVSWFAENAREGAIVAALATVATYCLVRALQADQGRRRWLIGYGGSLASLGFGNLFGLLIVVAHAVTLAWSRRRYRVDRGFVLGWLVAVAVTLIVVSPVAATGYGQLRQIHWLEPPTLKTVLSVQRVIGQTPLFVAAVVIILCALAVSWRRGRFRLPGSAGAQPPSAGPAQPSSTGPEQPPGPSPAQRSGQSSAQRPNWPAGLVTLCLPWLILPPAILLAASLAHPVYTFRDIVFCIPAAALLLGAALAALGRYAGPVALVAIVLIGLHTQIVQRRPDGHGISIRTADRIVAAHARPGDALLNISTRNGPRKASGERTLEAAYPYGLARLRDISTGVSPVTSGTLGGTYASSQQIHERLERVKRLWVVEWTTPKPVAALDSLGFRPVHRWDVNSLWLRFYIRHHVA